MEDLTSDSRFFVQTLAGYTKGFARELINALKAHLETRFPRLLDLEIVATPRGFALLGETGGHDRAMVCRSAEDFGRGYSLAAEVVRAWDIRDPNFFPCVNK